MHAVSDLMTEKVSIIKLLSDKARPVFLSRVTAMDTMLL